MAIANIENIFGNLTPQQYHVIYSELKKAGDSDYVISTVMTMAQKGLNLPMSLTVKSGIVTVGDIKTSRIYMELKDQLYKQLGVNPKKLNLTIEVQKNGTEKITLAI